MASEDRRETDQEEADSSTVNFQVRKLIVTQGQVFELSAQAGTDRERKIAPEN